MKFQKYRLCDQVLFRPMWLAAIFVVFATLDFIMCVNGLQAKDIVDITQQSPDTLSDPDIVGWVTFRDSIRGFEFQYPESLLTLTTSKNYVKLEHTVLFEHPDPCYFGDSDRVPLSHVRDFSVSIRVTAENLVSAIAHNTYLTTELPDIIKPGYLEGIKIGELLGYRTIVGAEGCGYYAYYFTLSCDTTLMVIRSFVTELSPIIQTFEDYMQLPGIITPEEEERLFYKLLSTFSRQR